MSGPELQRQLSLIPYIPDHRQVVLRHGNAIVVFDPQSQQLSLQATTAEQDVPSACPYCHRPLHDSGARFPSDQQAESSPDDGSFVDPAYFRLLAHSTPGTPRSSRQSSPIRSLPALRDASSRSESASVQGSQSPIGPPIDAEFIGSAPEPRSATSAIKQSSFLPGYFKKFFVEKRVLGRGGKGVVLLVEHLLDGVSLGDHACKRIPVGNDHNWLAKVLIEVQLLQRLHHPNLVSYHHVWLEDAQITKFGPSVPCVFIVQQYCDSGDLQQFVHRLKGDQTVSIDEIKRRRRLNSQGHLESPTGLGIRAAQRMPFDQIFSFFKDITSGLHHLHANGYIHRDLKPSNCLLHETNQRITVHVSDFGEVQDANATRASTGATGTISYCAPEVLQKDTQGGGFGNFTTKSDIFSLGMIVYFMCFGRLPYLNSDENEENEDLDLLRAEIVNWTGFDETKAMRGDLPDRLFKFLKRLLSLNPTERPSTDDLLRSIQGGFGLDDIGMVKAEDIGSSRFHSVDSPAPKRRRSLRSDGDSRHAPPSRFGDQSSQEKSRSMTSAAPQQSSNRHESPLRSEVVLSTRKIHDFSTPSSPEPRSPRLMLPPPPSGTPERLSSPDRQIHIDSILKAAMFVIKIVTLTYPCAPYAARPFVAYPLYVLAAMDLGIIPLQWPSSLSLFILHLVVVLVASRQSGLCDGHLTGHYGLEE